LIGSHLGENMHNLQVQELVTADTDGANLIVVDPRRSTAALRADIWLQIKPGTDIALLLAWAHILIRDGLHDHDFVRDFTSGFDLLTEHVAPTTPEWAAAETGLSIEEIEASARMIGEAGSHMALHPGRHVVWYGDDTQRARAMAILVAISGSWGSRGGYYLPQKAHHPSAEEVYPEMPEYPPLADRRDPGYPFAVGVNVNGIRQATIDGSIKAWVVVGTNLITSLPAGRSGSDDLRSGSIRVDPCRWYHCRCHRQLPLPVHPRTTVRDAHTRGTRGGRTSTQGCEAQGLTDSTSAGRVHRCHGLRPWHHADR
jgi:thiosulfate reductase/polysulfide reductase chain A